MAKLANGNREQILISKQTGFEQAHSGTFTEIALITAGVNNKKETVPSQTKRADRQKLASSLVGLGAEADFKLELSKDVPEVLFESAMMNTITVGDVDGGTSVGLISLVASSDTIVFVEDADLTPFAGARKIRVSGSADPLNNGLKTVVSVDVDTKTITLATGEVNSDDDTTSTIALGLNAKYIRTGVDSTYFTIEQRLTDVGTFFTAKDSICDGFNVSVSSKVLVEGGFKIISSKYGASLATESTTDVLAPSSVFINASKMLGGLSSGTEVLSDSLTELSINLSNGIRERAVIGSLYSKEHGIGDATVTGSASVYHQDLAVIEKMISHESVTIESLMLDENGNGYNFYLPEVKFDEAGPDGGGQEDDVKEGITFTASIDPTLGFTLQIDFVSAS